MEHKLATEEIKDQAALYALGALSQIEARAFENHMADGCDVCRAEVAEFDGVVGVLGLGAPAASPPAYLRDLLTERIAKEPRNVFTTQTSRTSYSPGAMVPPAARRSPWVTALPWAVAACLAIVAVSSVLSLRRIITSTNQEIAQMRLDFLHINEVLVRERQQNTEHLQVISVLEKPGSSHIFLLAQKDTPPSKANVYWDKQANRWLVAADMAPAPVGKIYQLWFLTKAPPKSAGLIKTDEAGHGFIEVDVPADIGKIDAAAITLEPEGGSAQPTMPIYSLGHADQQDRVAPTAN
jgi:anti-sigma-K factor RskA